MTCALASQYVDEALAQTRWDHENCIRRSLVGFAGQILAMLSHHSKVIAVDLTIFESEANSEFNAGYVQFSTFLEATLHRLRRRLCIKRLGYFWVKERTAEGAPHWHLILLLDGHRISGGHTLRKVINGAIPSAQHFNAKWARLAGDSRLRIAKRGDVDSITEMIGAHAYFAKRESKTQACGERRYGVSRLPAKC